MAQRSNALELDPQVSLAPQSIGGAVNGAGVDTAPGESALIVLNAGAATAPATVQIQESDDNITFTAVADSDLTNNNIGAPYTGNAAGVVQAVSTIVKVSYVGVKRYVRVATTAGTAALFSAEVVRGHLRHAGGVPV